MPIFVQEVLAQWSLFPKIPIYGGEGAFRFILAFQAVIFYQWLSFFNQ